MNRSYSETLKEHLCEDRQMLFLSGPRQVGKTTLARLHSDCYLDWDNHDHQKIILAGPESVAQHCQLAVLRDKPVVIAFDELHKYPHWKKFLKGFFDTYENRCRILVTGSARLDVYRHGGDSLMGRYFSYRMHPFSVGELLQPHQGNGPCITQPQTIADETWDSLWKHGGFPEPLLKNSATFSTRWQRMRNERLFKEELRDLSRAQDFVLLELLARVLSERSGDPVVFANLARDIQVAPNTVKHWIATLVSVHFGFLVRPWSKNINTAIKKEPKWYLRDWSSIKAPGKRAETLAACHLLKAVEYWTDLGLGDFELYYVKDKQQREVDFLVVKDKQPWFLVEVKHSETRLSPNLAHFQQQIQCPHALQMVVDLPYTAKNPFDMTHPVCVPAKTLLSQLP